VTTLPPAPCVLFALRREALSFRREYPFRERLPAAPCPAWRAGEGGEVLVLETGPGADATRAALGWALETDPLPFVVSAGFCGALAPHLSAGDVVLATEVVDAAGRCWPCSGPVDVPGVRAERGRLVTARSLVCSPDEKRRLGRESGAVAVDMEAATAAALCHDRAVPFACLRAVSDDCDTPLADALVRMLTGGRVAPLRLLGALVRRPTLAAELWRLARDTRKAARGLARVLAALLRAPRDEGGPLASGVRGVG
jgi:adenosylhomocysteine nucleosidase